MNKEHLARILVILFLGIGMAIPLVALWWASKNRAESIELHARMAEKGGWSLDTIHAQVGKPVHLRITSDDVEHGFAIGKQGQPDLVIEPGETVETTLTFDRPGTYTFYCNRWCGRNHWRMRGTIEVSGPAERSGVPQPLFLKLKLDVDASHLASVIPNSVTSAERGARFADLLPAYSTDRYTYLTSSPADLWHRLRKEPAMKDLSDADVWDAVAWIWQRHTTPEQLAEGQRLYSANCAACHGEAGKGDGVMVRGLPPLNHETMGSSLVRPPDFTDPRQLLGASPALLQGKMIRGGMGTGMPYWGPILTDGQLDELASFLYTFAWKATGPNLSSHAP